MMTRKTKREIIRACVKMLEKHCFRTRECLLQVAIWEQAVIDYFGVSDGSTHEDVMSADRYLSGPLEGLEAAGIEPDYARWVFRAIKSEIDSRTLGELQQHKADRAQSELML